jgi:hypothetical protein
MKFLMNTGDIELRGASSGGQLLIVAHPAFVEGATVETGPSIRHEPGR